MSRINKIWCFIRSHKYVMSVLFFIVLMTVVDENCLIVRLKHRAEIAALRSEINEYNRVIDHNRQQLKNLNNDPAFIRKLGRERYFMKEDNEDIFVFEEPVMDENEKAE